MFGKKKEESVLESVKKIIADTLEIDVKEVKEDSNLIADLGMESLDLVDLVVAFEEKYKVSIDDKDVKKLQTVKDIVTYIENKKEAK
jgi:acyl carrier protein